MTLVTPRYFDALIEGYHAGHAGRHVHLGYWDEPPPLSSACSAQEFEMAQARLNDLLVDLAKPEAGQTVLDVGCGFGGMLEALGKRPSLRLIGVNIDRRQLEICRSVPLGSNTLSLIVADACALPIGAGRCDRVLCVEAMFHFRDRAGFLREAAGALRSGGRVVLSDILLRSPQAHAPLPLPALEAAVRSEYGPWPQLWVTVDEILEMAGRAGLRLESLIDATRYTLPTYRFTAPEPPDRWPSRPSAGNVMRWLHSEGYLSYICMSLAKL